MNILVVQLFECLFYKAGILFTIVLTVSSSEFDFIPFEFGFHCSGFEKQKKSELTPV